MSFLKKNMRKKMKLSPTLQSTSNPSLPDDVLLSIFARVSRLYYPTLYLVSKSFRTLLASPELYKVRSLLGNTEICLYVCSRFQDPHHTNTSWFTLCRKPDQTLTNGTTKKSSGYVLARVPNLHSPPLHSSSLVAVGSNIYNIAGSCYLESSSSVSVLDCRSHTWREAPSLREGLCSVSASVIDRKIYVAGRSIDGDNNSKNSVEVFDTQTQIWDPEAITCSETQGDFYECKTTCIDRKFHVVTLGQKEAVAYNSKKRRWDRVRRKIDQYKFSAYCEIKNVLYSGTHGMFRWYDSKASRWRDLKGLEGLPKFGSGANIKLAGYGGKIAVLWEEDLPSCGPDSGYKKMIRCAEIALERRKSREIWGIIEWIGDVLTVPVGYVVLEKVLAVTL
ncbi:F-box domain [Arabidopsis suecica]|uniref:F-box domain n=1 Tax=Arabidopsis suecica TaxID=45249 RepID=A0A8T1ZSX9_ARASU|nr:F-box domain [Arabidopsis suecica]